MLKWFYKKKKPQKVLFPLPPLQPARPLPPPPSPPPIGPSPRLRAARGGAPPLTPIRGPPASLPPATPAACPAGTLLDSADPAPSGYKVGEFIRGFLSFPPFFPSLFKTGGFALEIFAAPLWSPRSPHGFFSPLFPLTYLNAPRSPFRDSLSPGIGAGAAAFLSPATGPGARAGPPSPRPSPASPPPSAAATRRPPTLRSPIANATASRPERKAAAFLPLVAAFAAAQNREPGPIRFFLPFRAAHGVAGGDYRGAGAPPAGPGWPLGAPAAAMGAGRHRRAVVRPGWDPRPGPG